MFSRFQILTITAVVAPACWGQILIDSAHQESASGSTTDAATSIASITNPVSGGGGSSASETTSATSATSATSDGTGDIGITSSSTEMDPGTTMDPSTSSGTTGLRTTSPESECPDADDVASLVFVTHDHFQGNLEPPGWWTGEMQMWPEGFTGAARGDLLCQCAAHRAGLSGVFVAWLSESMYSVRTFLLDGIAPVLGPRCFVRLDGLSVASSWHALASENHAEAISLTEYGVNVAIDAPELVNDVWTGSTDNGDVSAPQGDPLVCSNWGQIGGRGGVGHLDEVAMSWSEYLNKMWNDNECVLAKRLYCVQLAEDPADAAIVFSEGHPLVDEKILMNPKEWCPLTGP